MAKDFILQRFGYFGNLRGGPILLYDDFEDLLKWDWHGGGSGSKIDKVGTKPFDKNYCLGLQSEYDAGQRLCWVSGWRKFPFGVSARVRLECVFRTDDWGTEGSFKLFLYNTKQGELKYGSFRYSSRFHAVYIDYGPYGRELEVGALSGELALGCYHRLSLGVDLEKGRYTHIELNHKTADVSQVELVTGIGGADFGAVDMLFMHRPPRRPPMYRWLYVDQVLVLEE